jgi:hypothetical protein
MGLNPTTNDPVAGTGTRNGNVFEFTYSRSVSALNAGAIFTVEWTDALTGAVWSAVGVTEQVLFDPGTLERVKATVPVGSLGRRFVHLKVSAP